ncbi:S1/P1 nuclease [Acidicapsa acidisoli]|uniref:S1/P1 nuclease n=1 Tax=Acidicapsa acidisoli TaxID=1615681 RepID=UPI0021DF6DAD|nr:S1/P1 nuclease [Acidicapsa acidisoli]
MRFNLRSAAVITVCLLFTFQNAMGWNSIGHMAVAYVAYQQLTLTQKARVAALLALNPNYKKWLAYIKPGASQEDQQMYVFMMAATWPDEIKANGSGYKSDGDNPPKTSEASANIGYKDMVMHKYWHFVDLPFSTDGTTPLPAVPTPNAQTQIAALRKALASDEPDALKSYDLVWLMHLTGDVHQPLHCATRVTQTAKRGDAGGNSVKIDVAPQELHGYWDNLLGVGDTQNYSVALTAAQLLSSADATAAADLNEADWVNESFALAKSSVYINPPIGPGLGTFTIGSNPNYGSDSLKIAQQRVALAGARLANVLNAELK